MVSACACCPPQPALPSRHLPLKSPLTPAHPVQFLPVRYDYGRTVPEEHCCGSEGEEGGSTRECLICLGSVDLADKADRAVTPCCHVFHRACLERWTNVKPECPTCRHALPPL